MRSKILYQFHHVLHVESCCFLVIICSPTIPTGGIAENGNASFAFPPNVVDKTVYLNLPSTGCQGTMRFYLSQWFNDTQCNQTTHYYSYLVLSHRYSIFTSLHMDRGQPATMNFTGAHIGTLNCGTNNQSVVTHNNNSYYQSVVTHNNNNNSYYQSVVTHNNNSRASAMSSSDASNRPVSLPAGEQSNSKNRTAAPNPIANNHHHAERSLRDSEAGRPVLGTNTTSSEVANDALPYCYTTNPARNSVLPPNPNQQCKLSQSCRKFILHHKSCDKQCVATKPQQCKLSQSCRKWI